MSTADYVPDLARALERLVPDEGLALDWEDVVGRAGVRLKPRVAGRRVRLAIAVALLLILLTGVATATYLATRKGQPPPSVSALDASGSLDTVWQCTDRRCGAFAYDAAISPNGRYLAVTVDTVNAPTVYDGLHIIDLATGADRELPEPSPNAATPAASAAWRRQYLAESRLLGCAPSLSAPAHELAWSPDSSRLAYECPGETTAGRIYSIRPDGTGRRLLQTGTKSAYWPTWSPDGTRIAFSTEDVAPVGYSGRTKGYEIYVVDLNGAHRRLVARVGFAPDWSPDGTTIAYSAPGCTSASLGRTRLVTPDGRDITPHSHGDRCGGIGPSGNAVAAWSPDGRLIAVRTGRGMYLMNADGRHVTAVPGTDGFGDSRPVWAPR